METIYTCASIDQSCYSDTQNVADFSLPKSKIAYITVDIDSEYPVIVWEKNNYSSFWYVDLFNDNPIRTGITDTFYIDKISGGDPKGNSLKYVIAAVDSCTKRWDYLPEDFHYTINLKGSIDTCKNIINLNWTKYIGWSDSIRYYYIYKMLNKSNYYVIDSVSNLTTNYSIKTTTNEIVDYYVAAVNSKHLNYRSCSNNVSFITGNRNSNQNLKINYVTLDNNININIGFDLGSDLESMDIYKSTDAKNYSYYKSLNNSISPINIIDNNEFGNRRVYYYLVSKNSCGIYTDTTAVSTNIVLENIQGTGENKLWWNKYFTWNSGVEKYIIYRETRLNEVISKPFSQKGTTNDSIYNDNILNEDLGIEKLCYKIISVENITGYTSASNTVCMVGGLTVFFPNGVISRTEKNLFKPVGLFIDYSKSTMLIFNRWGKLVKEVNDLNIGWDLSDSNNNFAETDTYVYEAHIVGLDGKETNKSGTITIIR
ncbi:MAG: gliding motility-associated C-terminal domain-containing protein [Bacteroidia bacterium]|nr:gliding motility-associated C-terminal domain-containing protein [Bacteroidia bacterium]